MTTGTAIGRGPVYRVRVAAATAAAGLLDSDWDHPLWRQAAPIPIDHFHARSSDHHPHAAARLLYDQQALYLAFRVQDRFVRCVHTEYQGRVYADSCVEMMVWPKRQAGYFNFEVNCGGALLLHYNELELSADSLPPKITKTTPLPAELGRQVRIVATMPAVVEPEIIEPLSWQIRMRIPLAVLESRVGPLGALPGQRWRANFYKCADETSHPHWASWAEIGPELNFHQPHQFGTIVFE
ncbi:MAG TPA: carbohydrate-binding family 9-like protein [Tepidisphaeraceae bacterium]|nr:carbohydrate-binding family 9-like protein [Tepidisphaeraceae bacterium]